LTKEYLEKQKITFLSWPASSPDLNNIENRWSIIDNKLLKVTINYPDELKNAIQTAWSDILNDTIRKLFESLPERIRQVIKHKGFAYSS
jgi:hypothetical protein